MYKYTKDKRIYLMPVFRILMIITICCHFYNVEANTVYTIPTFESIGIYLKTDDSFNQQDNKCIVHYREINSNTWIEAHPLWFDKRNGEYRGSIVGLTPGTLYEIQLRLSKVKNNIYHTVRTWSENFPVDRTIYLSNEISNEPLVINEGGSPSGYILYTGHTKDNSIIDVYNQHPFCVLVDASYVIIRGLTLKNAQQDGIRLGDVHDVIIEKCDISGWGRKGKGSFGKNLDSGIGSRSEILQNIVIQRNRIHHPRYGANSWTEKGDYKDSPYHPWGPQGISWGDNLGNHVIRYNQIYTDNFHRFNDGMGWVTNFSYKGFPGADSDIYGNMIINCWDDGLEIEGGGRNIRIWGNYINNTYVGIATCVCSIGPLYIFRNVFDRSQFAIYPEGDSDALRMFQNKRKRENRGYFAKVGELERGGSGRQYWFHNTMLQKKPPCGYSKTLGGQNGIIAVGRTNRITNLVSLNNIWHVFTSAADEVVNHSSIHPKTSSRSNLFDYDLYNGVVLQAYEEAEENGLKAIPIYADGNGAEGGPWGKYQLDSNSPGYDDGKLIPNFNDNYIGEGPDIGAHEAGTRRMEFGVDAYVSY